MNSPTTSPRDQRPSPHSPSTEDLRFRYDGRFVPNPKVAGKWCAVATVGAIGQYDPKSKNLLVKPLFKDIDLQSNGGTDSTSFLWTGDILMDLDRTQARKMELNTLDGGDNLLSEAGGFGSANPAGWKPPADGSQAPLTLSE